ncbi:hypothetical protein GLV94_02875 [Virgibacillus halodenitrificans]|uniref:hypothetical protein n=1 Tax=Virgibacillus halodenitrificans TaxID=1482 RepID=UPI0013681A88|nr:hypothetical protein [Virgibacillus halodenitrificans]MYL44577.1 hypothetical protein [Virgibacillus halodenitrificans]
MENRIEELETKYNTLREMLTLIDEYSRHFMAQTLVQFGIIVTIATALILGAAYFMIKSMINNKIDTEIERKMVRLLRDTPPVYYAKGKAKADSNNKLYLGNEIEGINDLDPSTVMIIDAKPEVATWDQIGNNLNPKLKINEKGIREIEVENYSETNGEITWSIAWVRKKF